MKIFVDYISKIQKIEQDKWFQSEDMQSILSIYVANNIKEEYYVSVEFQRADGVKITRSIRDAFAVEEMSIQKVNGVEYQVHHFTLDKFITEVAGVLKFTAYINFVKNTDDLNNIKMVKNAVLCNGGNNILKTISFSNGDYLYYDVNDDSDELKSLITLLQSAIVNQQKVDAKTDELVSAVTNNRVGLLRAGDYDEKTGEIEMYYANDIVKSLDYNDKTGELLVKW